MLKIENRPAPTAAQARLELLHDEVKGKASFAEKVKTAGDLWKAKKGSASGVLAFDAILRALFEMSVGEGICNYCEQSEAGDIEHIWPKRFFPLRAFQWTNYLYACKQCNTGNKLDQAWIFDPQSGNIVKKCVREMEPSTQDFCFIDPRTDDPMKFMQLELTDSLFYPRTMENEQERSRLKAEKTLEILELNLREGLVTKRRDAFKNFRRLLQEYVAVKTASTHADLEAAIYGDPPIDSTADLETERQRMMLATQKELLRQTHLTVFKEMQRQVDSLPASVKALFVAAPEALGW